jgi:hypothetical protein
VTTPIAQPESQTERLDKLEREHRNLITRVERLEKQRGSLLAALAGNVLLLVVAGLMADYLGILPHPVQRPPLQASSVETDELVLRAHDGKPWGKILVTKDQVVLVRLEGDGHPTKEVPLIPHP